ncbi:MAG TPA: trehalose-6-phosphate synthase [Acidimicrobiales bacterium]|nr:trehalose-6-phosphate synthase [Acidimicrobiales bacterium]
MTAPLVVLSNRGPIAFHFDEAGEPVAGRAGGGLASTLGGGVRGDDAVWVAAAMGDADRAAAKASEPDGEVRLHGYRVRLVDIAAETFEAAYNVVANETLWFWHHHMFDSAHRPRLDSTFRAAWDCFKDVNLALASAAATAAAPDATVLVHDYQLALAPAMLRRLRPDLRIAHFTHTPFVDPALLTLLPDDVVEQLLLGMGGADACGFHSPRWADAFEACWRAHPATRALPIPRTFIAPAAADQEEVANVAASDGCAGHAAYFDDVIGDRACIVRVDRIEPSKNLLRGLWAYRQLLAACPEWRNRVTLLAMCYPSREALAEYQALIHDVVETADALNREFGTEDWSPVILDTDDDFNRSVAALRRADVLLVNPIRDGLNLVAYEGPSINERDVVLVLSREAGAWDELGPAGAIVINPFDVVGTADALHQALTLDPAEKRERNARLRAAARARTPQAWLDAQIVAAAR